MDLALYTYVRFIDGSALPPGQDWMIVLCGKMADCDHLAVFIDRDKVTERNLEDAWDAVRECSRNAGLNAPVLPRQRGTGLPYTDADVLPRPMRAV